jgi:hypothetical protein
MLTFQKNEYENFRIQSLLHLEARLEVTASGTWKAIKKLPTYAYNGVVDLKKFASDKYKARQARLEFVKRLEVAARRIQEFIKFSGTYMKNRQIFTKEIKSLISVLDELEQFAHNAEPAMLQNFDDDKPAAPSAPPGPAAPPNEPFQLPQPQPPASYERQRTPYPPPSGPPPYRGPPYNPSANAPLPPGPVAPGPYFYGPSPSEPSSQPPTRPPPAPPARSARSALRRTVAFKPSP